jgi:RNA polymerase sigma factor (sigma-70 family)
MHKHEDQAVPGEQLLPAVARGEAQAVEVCMARYAPLVWSLAKKLSRDVNTLEELVQEIFVDIWRSAGRFDPAKASEAAFIATIARRRVIDRQRRSTRSEPAEELEESSAGAEDPGFEAIDTRDEARRASAALDLLKPNQRRLILMSVVEGLTHEEIATATGLPLGTIKSHIRRGLDRAARFLRGRREEEAR